MRGLYDKVEQEINKKLKSYEPEPNYSDGGAIPDDFDFSDIFKDIDKY